MRALLMSTTSLVKWVKIFIFREQAEAVLAKDDSKPCKVDELFFMGGMKAALNKAELKVNNSEWMSSTFWSRFFGYPF